MSKQTKQHNLIFENLFVSKINADCQSPAANPLIVILEQTNRLNVCLIASKQMIILLVEANSLGDASRG